MGSTPERNRRDSNPQISSVTPTPGRRLRDLLDVMDRAGEPEPALSKTEAFEILRNDRRRRVITYLQTNGKAAGLEELTRHVAAAEYGVPNDDVTSTQYKRVYTGLYQSHLPMMDEHDIISFDPTENRITLRGRARPLLPYVMERAEYIPRLLSVGAALALVTFVGLWASGFGPIASVPTAAIAILATLTIIAVTAHRSVTAAPAPITGP